MKGLARAVMLVGLMCASAGIFAADLKVGPDAPYKKIQDAINAASTNDTIEVAANTYIENITLRAGITLTLIGKETAQTFLKALDSSKPIITASGVTNSRVSRFTFIDSTTGIQLSNASAVTITANVFHLGSNGTAVNVTDAADTSMIRNNTFYSNKLAVNRVGGSNTIQNNIFLSNTTAIPGANVATGINTNLFFPNTTDGQTGTGSLTSDPLFVSPADRDFHLKVDSPAFNTGTGTDADLIDGSPADLGAYGGPHADPTPFPVKKVMIGDSTAVAPPAFNVPVSWLPNESYLVESYNVKFELTGGTNNTVYFGTPTISSTSPQNVKNALIATLSGSTAAPAGLSIAPNLNAIEPKSQGLILTWSSVANATSYEVRYGVTEDRVTRISETSKNVGNVTTYTLSGLENRLTYLVTVVAVQQPILRVAVNAQDSTTVARVSNYSTEVTKALGVEAKSGESNKAIGIPEEVVAYPALPNEGCFIATAAYGSYSAAQVKTLRDFRDHYLLTNKPGRAFVTWYYANSPQAAQYLNQHPALKPVVRGLLLPVVLITSGLNDSMLGMQVALIALALGMIGLGLYWRRRHTSWA